ncbi:hypothetical protein HME9304_01051 [Flagellimonas maritima]|uniref:DUF1697 domain-containing protein n=1 Tax=Flagellimonas maritima TaxID=1383885 RepID=A0A2Z4LQA0_9FLAO|nr:DUF1697 domain-containing protein [Allomuricauda aurantiaca]AWX44051.1 hypothetical protein HME9304_01051 [Allomuricauda aurantiaca]
MKTYIALLRGINVGGQKKIGMADLRQTLEKASLQNVETYIQSGNVVFKSEETDMDFLQKVIHDAILSSFGFDVPTLVTTGENLKNVLSINPFLGRAEENKLYFAFLKKPPVNQLIEEFNKEQFINEEFYIKDTCVFLYCKTGYGKAKLNNNLIERKLKVEATTRNLNTIQKLIAIACKSNN